MTFFSNSSPHSTHTLLLTLTLLTFLFPYTLSSSSPSPLSSSHHKPFTKIYAFGDSYTDTGNTISKTGPSGFNYVSNPPYGMTFFHHPTNRYSDGRLVIDFVSQSLSLPLLPPYLSGRGGGGGSDGVNFAVAGSTAIEHQFFVKNNFSLDVTPESLETQLGWFSKYLEKEGCNGKFECGKLFEDALVWVGEIGANDYAYCALTDFSKSVLQSLAIARISGFLEAILKKGAKYVVVQGLPPTGCLTLSLYLAPPDDRDELGCVRSANQQSYTHNTLLQSKIQDLRKQFPQAFIVYADYYNAYAHIMKNPIKFGFKEAFRVCCGSGAEPYNYEYYSVCGSPFAKPCSEPSQYINWDGVHLTEAMNKAVSGLLLQGGYSYPPFQELVVRKKSVPKFK